jgi:hypothetical protein
MSVQDVAEGRVLGARALSADGKIESQVRALRFVLWS